MNKKLLTIAAITSMTLASTAVLHADNHSAKKDKAENSQKDANLFAGLKLTPEQSLQIATIDESYNPRFAILQEQITALKEQYNGLDSSSANYAQELAILDDQKVSLMEERESLKAQHHEEVFAVLDDKQKQQMNRAK